MHFIAAVLILVCTGLAPVPSVASQLVSEQDVLEFEFNRRQQSVAPAGPSNDLLPPKTLVVAEVGLFDRPMHHRLLQVIEAATITAHDAHLRVFGPPSASTNASSTPIVAEAEVFALANVSLDNLESAPSALLTSPTTYLERTGAGRTHSLTLVIFADYNGLLPRTVASRWLTDKWLQTYYPSYVHSIVIFCTHPRCRLGALDPMVGLGLILQTRSIFLYCDLTEWSYLFGRIAGIEISKLAVTSNVTLSVALTVDRASDATVHLEAFRAGYIARCTDMITGPIIGLDCNNSIAYVGAVSRDVALQQVSSLAGFNVSIQRDGNEALASVWVNLAQSSISMFDNTGYTLQLLRVSGGAASTDGAVLDDGSSGQSEYSGFTWTGPTMLYQCLLVNGSAFPSYPATLNASALSRLQNDTVGCASRLSPFVLGGIVQTVSQNGSSTFLTSVPRRNSPVVAQAASLFSPPLVSVPLRRRTVVRFAASPFPAANGSSTSGLTTTAATAPPSVIMLTLPRSSLVALIAVGRSVIVHTVVFMPLGLVVDTLGLGADRLPTLLVNGSPIDDMCDGGGVSCSAWRLSADDAGAVDSPTLSQVPPGNGAGDAVPRFLASGGNLSNSNSPSAATVVSLFRAAFSSSNLSTYLTPSAALKSQTVARMTGLTGEPAPRTGHSLTVVGDVAYMYGGILSGSNIVSGELWSVSITTGSWRLLTTSLPRTHHTATLVNTSTLANAFKGESSEMKKGNMTLSGVSDFLWILFGFGDRATNDATVPRFMALAVNHRRVVTSFPNPGALLSPAVAASSPADRVKTCTILFEERLYVIGGRPSSRAADDTTALSTLVFAFATFRWSALPATYDYNVTVDACTASAEMGSVVLASAQGAPYPGDVDSKRYAAGIPAYNISTMYLFDVRCFENEVPIATGAACRACSAGTNAYADTCVACDGTVISHSDYVGPLTCQVPLSVTGTIIVVGLLCAVIIIVAVVIVTISSRRRTARSRTAEHQSAMIARMLITGQPTDQLVEELSNSASAAGNSRLQRSFALFIQVFSAYSAFLPQWVLDGTDLPVHNTLADFEKAIDDDDAAATRSLAERNSAVTTVQRYQPSPGGERSLQEQGSSASNRGAPGGAATPIAQQMWLPADSTMRSRSVAFLHADFTNIANELNGMILREQAAATPAIVPHDDGGDASPPLPRPHDAAATVFTSSPTSPTAQTIHDALRQTDDSTAAPLLPQKGPIWERIDFVTRTVARCTDATNGIVVSLLGDRATCGFGVFRSTANPSFDAVVAAIGMYASFRKAAVAAHEANEGLVADVASSPSPSFMIPYFGVDASEALVGVVGELFGRRAVVVGPCVAGAEACCLFAKRYGDRLSLHLCAPLLIVKTFRVVAAKCIGTIAAPNGSAQQMPIVDVIGMRPRPGANDDEALVVEIEDAIRRPLPRVPKDYKTWNSVCEFIDRGQLATAQKLLEGTAFPPEERHELECYVQAMKLPCLDLADASMRGAANSGGGNAATDDDMGDGQPAQFQRRSFDAEER